MEKMIGVCSLMALGLLVSGAFAQTPGSQLKREPPNLVKNGDFSDAADPLAHWIYMFDNNKWYLQNHTHVSVVPDKASMKPHVLQLDASDHDVCINWGVQVYTEPVRFDPKKLYKVSLSTRSVGVNGGPGPKCRIYPIAYRWKPNATKSAEPSFYDLREAVRFQPIYFDATKTGEFSMVQKQWKRAETVIPNNQRSELQQTHLENCEWLMLKIMALDATGVNKCNNGYLYVDDVKIQEIGVASDVKINPGANTKGFDGKSWKTATQSESQKKLTPISGPHPVKKPDSKKAAR